MKSNRFLFLLVWGLIIFSCKKDDTFQIDYPSVYHKSGVRIAGGLMLFSSHGEITDPAVVSRFSQLDTSNFTFYANYIRDNDARMDSVFLQDPQHAVIKEYGMPRNCRLNEAGNRLVLTTVDTIVGYSPFDEYTSSPGYYIGQFKPEVFTEYITSSVRGAYSFGFTGRETFVFDKSGGQFTAPIIIFNNHRGWQQNMSHVNNILAEDFYKRIVVGDTLSLIRYQVLYEK